MGAAEFEAAGVYDPRDPNAADRLELPEFLVAHGATMERIVAAHRVHALGELATDIQLRPGPRLTAREVAERNALSVEQVLALSLAVGLPPRDADDPIYDEHDAVTFSAYGVAAELFGATAARRFVRVVGSSLARIAEA